MYTLLLNKYNNLLQPKYHVQKLKVHAPCFTCERLKTYVLLLPLHMFLLQVTYNNENKYNNLLQLKNRVQKLKVACLNSGLP